MLRRILITGAAGFIGMHTAIKFLKEGWSVVGLDNFNDYYDVSLKRARSEEIHKVSVASGMPFELIEKDLNSNVWDCLKEQKFDAVVHLAAQAGVRYSLENPWAYLESNISGFQRVLDFVESNQIRHFLYASSSSVYGKNTPQPFSETAPCASPESFYAATKRANELMAQSYFHTKNVRSIGLRFFTVYGPWGRPDMAPMLFAEAASTGKGIEVYNYGKQQRDFTFISDVVEGIFLLAVRPDIPDAATVCNIGNGSPVGLMDFISLIETSLDCEIEKKLVKAQKGDVVSTFADTSKLQSLVNYEPKVGLEEGIPMFMEWFKSYFNVK